MEDNYDHLSYCPTSKECFDFESWSVHVFVVRYNNTNSDVLQRSLRIRKWYSDQYARIGRILKYVLRILAKGNQRTLVTHNLHLGYGTGPGFRRKKYWSPFSTFMHFAIRDTVRSTWYGRGYGMGRCQSSLRSSLQRTMKPQRTPFSLSTTTHAGNRCISTII